MGFGNNIQHQERGFYYADSATDNSQDGRSLEHPKKTIQGAIDAAAAISPPPSVSDNIFVREAQGGLFAEDIALSDFTVFDGPQTNIFSSGLVGITASTQCSFKILAIINNTDNATALKVDAQESFGLVTQALRTGGDSGIAIEIVGTHSDLFFTVDQMQMNGEGSTGVSLAGSGTNPIDFDFDTASFSADNCTFFDFHPDNATDTADLSISSLFDMGTPNTGTKGIVISEGALKVKAGSLQAITVVESSGGQLGLVACAIAGNTIVTGGNVVFDSVGIIIGDLDTENAGTLQVRSTNIIGDAETSGTGGMSVKCDQFTGDITIGSGTTAFLIIDNHVGTLTNNGSINGIVNGVQYGDWVQATAWGDITGTLSNQSDLQSALDAKQTTSEKSQINGYASLDSNGKVPAAELPNELMHFKGNWNADTNTPTLANTDTNIEGFTYRVSVAGTQDFGAGNITFAVGDWVYNNGTIWDKGDNTDAVASVFGRVGTVTAQSGDYTKSQVGLGNVDNTSDVDKPVSTAQQTEIDTKEDAFSKNTAFNKNFGTSAGTVLEGDTAIPPAAPVDSVNGKTGVVTLDTSDIDPSADRNYVTDSEATVIDNTSGTNTGDQDLSGLAPLVHTHTASDVTDFDTEVSNNTSVAANTSKVSADGSVTTHNDITSAGSGQIITSGERTNLSNQSGTNTGDEVDASETVKGIVERATDAEAAAGTDTTRYVTPKQLKDNDGGLGYILATWGANLQTVGHHPAINSPSNSAQITSLGIMASMPVPAAGTIDTITYYNSTGDNTTEFQIIKNGVVMYTFTCVGPYGVETGINVPIGFVGSVPDNIAIRYSAGTAPSEGLYTAYIK